MRQWTGAKCRSGSWSCQNALMYGAQWSERGANPRSSSEFDYARIAAISGWTPMMLMTRVRL